MDRMERIDAGRLVLLRFRVRLLHAAFRRARSVTPRVRESAAEAEALAVRCFDREERITRRLPMRRESGYVAYTHLVDD